jgi:uncharacterized protein (TIGR02284 family)
MNTVTPYALNLLDRLIHLCREASFESGLAARHMHDPEVRAVLESGIEEHAGHAQELEQCVVPTGDRSNADRFIAALPRNPGGSDLARALARGDELEILAACARAQRMLLAAYAEAAEDSGLGPEAAEIVREQAETVAARHSLLRACGDRAVHHENVA